MSESLTSKSPPTVDEAFARYVQARHVIPLDRCNAPGDLMAVGSSHDDGVATRTPHQWSSAAVPTDFDDPGPGGPDTQGYACSSDASRVRQDERMPWNVHQVASLPAPVDEAFEVVKTRLRIQLAHYLADHPEARIGEIIDAVGSERATVRSNLHALEELGVVYASLPTGQRESQLVRYSLNRTRWTEMIIRVITYLPAAPNS